MPDAFQLLYWRSLALLPTRTAQAMRPRTSSRRTIQAPLSCRGPILDDTVSPVSPHPGASSGSCASVASSNASYPGAAFEIRLRRRPQTPASVTRWYADIGSFHAWSRLFRSPQEMEAVDLHHHDQATLYRSFYEFMLNLRRPLSLHPHPGSHAAANRFSTTYPCPCWRFLSLLAILPWPSAL